MQTDSILFVICLVALLVVAVNGGLLVLLLRSRMPEEIRLLRKAASTARDPWRKEDQDLAELRRRVTDLEGKGPSGEQHGQG